MDEWIDHEEWDRRKWERLNNRFIRYLTRDIRQWQIFTLIDLFLCALNAGLGLRNLILAWADDQPWLALLGIISTTGAVFVGHVGLKSRRRVRAFRSLRASMIGVGQAKTRNQFELYADQSKAAMRNLLANR